MKSLTRNPLLVLMTRRFMVSVRRTPCTKPEAPAARRQQRARATRPCDLQDKYLGSMSQRNARFCGRSASAQALVESAAGIVVITMVVVLLLMFMVNLYNVISYRTRLESVAIESAKVFEGNKYWLGMKRVDFKQEDATTKAQSMAEALCAELGLPALANPASYEEKTTPDGSSYVVCTLQAKMSLPYINSVFPSFLNFSATGVSAAGGMGIHPPAVVNFSAHSVTPGKGGRLVGCQLPAYSLYTDNNAPLGQCSPPSEIKMPYSYTGYAMGDNIRPMLINEYAGDSTVWDHGVSSPQ